MVDRLGADYVRWLIRQEPGLEWQEHWKLLTVEIRFWGTKPRVDDLIARINEWSSRRVMQ